MANSYGPERELAKFEYDELVDHVRFKLSVSPNPTDKNVVIFLGDTVRQCLVQSMTQCVDAALRGLEAFYTETGREREKNLEAVAKREQKALDLRFKFSLTTDQIYVEAQFWDKFHDLILVIKDIIETFHKQIRETWRKCLAEAPLAEDGKPFPEFWQEETTMAESSLNQIQSIALVAKKDLMLHGSVLRDVWASTHQQFTIGTERYKLVGRDADG